MNFDLDNILGREKIPAKYSGLSFLQWDTNDEERYQKLNHHQQREMAYWVETQAIRRGANMGVVVGIIIGFVATCIYLAIF